MKGRTKKKKKKGRSGAMSGTGLTFLHCLASFPPSPSSQGLGLGGGGSTKSDKKTPNNPKAAFSNRHLPKGCHGNRGARGTLHPPSVGCGGGVVVVVWLPCLPKSQTGT